MDNKTGTVLQMTDYTDLFPKAWEVLCYTKYGIRPTAEALAKTRMLFGRQTKGKEKPRSTDNTRGLSPTNTNVNMLRDRSQANSKIINNLKKRPRGGKYE